MRAVSGCGWPELAVAVVVLVAALLGTKSAVNRTCEVGWGDGSVHNFGAASVGASVDDASGNAATRDQNAERMGPVISTALGINQRGAPELGRDDHQGPSQESAIVQVCEQGGCPLIQLWQRDSQPFVDVPVVVPAIVDNSYDARTCLDEAPGVLQALSERVKSVSVPGAG